MATEFAVSFVIQGGVLKVQNRPGLEGWARNQRNCEGTATFVRKHATRSVNQNAWYWSQIVGLISEHTGYTPDETHEVLKQLFLPKKLAVAAANGEIVNELVIGGTTTTLNKLEFADYCERIRLWAQEQLNIDIPDPTERVA